jgi:hypothetical protein
VRPADEIHIGRHGAAVCDGELLYRHLHIIINADRYWRLSIISQYPRDSSEAEEDFSVLAFARALDARDGRAERTRRMQRD